MAARLACHLMLGNSGVDNALGCGRIFEQGASLVEAHKWSFVASETWQ